MDSPIHICILTTAHPLDDVRVSNKFAQTFRQEGFRVTWVGPEYAYFDHEHYNRYGLDYQLYRKNVTRLDRVLSGRMAYATASRLKDVDIYYSPEPDSAALAVRLAKKNGVRVIFDIHEVYHDAMLSGWVKGWRLRLLRPVARRLIERTCARCDLVIGVSRAVLKPYERACRNAMIVRSCAPEWFAQGLPADIRGSGRSGLVLMHGKSTLNRGTAVVLEAISIARKHVSGLRVIFFDTFSPKGDSFGVDQFMSLVEKFGVKDCVDLRQPVPMQEMPEVLKSCDAGLIAYNRDFGQESLPNKLFEYMATGLAIIAPSYSPEIVRILEEERCGLLADFEDPMDIATAIVSLYRDETMCKEMGRRSREGFVRRHNWQVEVGPIIKWVRSK